jgi:hypothetical protein
VLLALDVGQVDDRLGVGHVLDGDAAGQGRERELALEVGDELGQRLDGNDVDAVDEGGFGSVDGRDEDGPDPPIAGQADHRQDPLEVAQGAVQRELAEEDDLRGVSGDLLGRQQNADRDREIVRWPGLADLGGGEVHGDAAGRKDQTAISDGGADALARLLDGSVRQPDDVELHEPLPGDVDFDLDELALQAHDGAGPDLRQHRALLSGSSVPLREVPRGAFRYAWPSLLPLTCRCTLSTLASSLAIDGVT